MQIYFKIDLLNNGIYNGIENETHLDKLLETEVNWSLFEHKEIVEQLFHIAKHFEIVKQHQPKNIEQLAMILAMIRPGKRYLVGKDWKPLDVPVLTDAQGNFSLNLSAQSRGVHSFRISVAADSLWSAVSSPIFNIIVR